MSIRHPSSNWKEKKQSDLRLVSEKTQIDSTQSLLGLVIFLAMVVTFTQEFSVHYLFVTRRFLLASQWYNMMLLVFQKTMNT